MYADVQVQHHPTAGYITGYRRVPNKRYPVFVSLTELAIRSAKPQPKPYKLFDEKGLFLLVRSNGARLWRFKYFISGVEKLLSLGAYPDVSLKRARDKRDQARSLVA